MAINESFGPAFHAADYTTHIATDITALPAAHSASHIEAIPAAIKPALATAVSASERRSVVAAVWRSVAGA